MTKTLEELRYLLTEDLYIIDEPAESGTDSEHPVKVEEEISEVPEVAKITAPVLIVSKLPLNEAHAALLKKIMTAVKVEGKDLDYLDINSFEELNLNDIDSSKVLVFGEASSNEVLPEQKYVPQKIKDKTLLWSKNFSVLEADVNEKKLLWSALQKIFDIN